MKPFLKFFAIPFIVIALLAMAFIQKTPHEVCATENFGEFISQFMNLTADQQYTCVKYPVNDGKNSNFNLIYNVSEIKTEKQLKAILGNGSKIVFSPEEVYNASRPFFWALDQQGVEEIQPSRTGYVYTSQPEGMGLALTDGGTFIFSEFRFARINGNWLLTSACGFLDDETNDKINNVP